MKITTWAMRRFPVIGLLVTAFSGPGFAADTEFSAEMSQQGPQEQQISGKLFVSGKRVRTEMSHQGQQTIQITDEDRGVQWLLLPDRKKYLEQKLDGQPGQLPGVNTMQVENPCDGMPGLTCNRLGEEEINGRAAVKWEIIASSEGETVQGVQWIDKARGLPLRQEMPGGLPTMEFKFIAMEQLNGRQVEKWEMTVTMPDQPEKRAFHWFDPELDLTVRREFPGGMVSELKNIRVGEQPDELFSIPAGYERMALPQGMPGGPPPQPPGKPADQR